MLFEKFGKESAKFNVFVGLWDGIIGVAFKEEVIECGENFVWVNVHKEGNGREGEGSDSNCVSFVLRER